MRTRWSNQRLVRHNLGVRPVPETTPIAALEWRKRALVAGRVKTLRLQPRSEVPTLECVLVDDSGATITLVFLGRRSIAGVRSGAHLAADGMVGKYEGKLAMINPLYELLAVESSTKARAEECHEETAKAVNLRRFKRRSDESGGTSPWPWVRNPRLLAAIAVAFPIAIAALLTLGRGHLSAADNALVLVVVTVAIASSGSPGTGGTRGPCVGGVIRLLSHSSLRVIPHQQPSGHDHRGAVRRGWPPRRRTSGTGT